MKLALSSSIAAIALLLPGTASAQSAMRAANCQLHIDSISADWIIQGYDPFGNSDPLATFDVIFRNDGGAACTFDAVFVTDQEPFGLTNLTYNGRVAYTLLDTFTNVNATPLSGRTIASAARRPIVLPPNSQQVVRYQFAANDEGLTADGLYSQRLSLVAEQRGTGESLASRALIVGVNVLPSAVLGLSGQYQRNGSQAVVDLGELQDGVSGVSLQVRVSSTRAYRLEFASKNSGLLRLSDTQWSIPYEITVGNKTIALGGRGQYESGGSNPASDVLPLHFVINGASGKRAGVYSDLLTISIAPK